MSQNLVANWSFEDTIPCISNPFFGAPETAPPWERYMKTADFASLTYCGGGIPLGFQFPKSGDSFVGAGVYDSMDPMVNEIFGQELADSLQAGHTYCVSFYVSLADDSQFGIDQIGALFTSFEPDPIYLSTVAVAQIENPAGQFITDTLNWIQISDSFVAQGGEKFISLGNFNTPGNFQTISVPYTTSYTGAYYYFDDISVIDCSVGLDEWNELNVSVFPNPCIENETIHITFPYSRGEDYSIQMFSSIGACVYKQTHLAESKISIPARFDAGVYHLQILSKNSYANSKIIVVE